MGTTAEVPCLSTQEKKNIIKVVKEANHNRLPMIIGIGGNNTYKLLMKFVKLIYHFWSNIVSFSIL